MGKMCVHMFIGVRLYEYVPLYYIFSKKLLTVRIKTRMAIWAGLSDF
jgi:hypothetical protein